LRIKALKISAGVLAGLSLLTLGGPILGEMIAVFPPAFPRDRVDPLAALGLPYEEVAFPTTDGLTLRGWLIPAHRPDAPAIVYAPSTAHDQRSGLSLAPAFHRAGYHVLLFSYRGHALSDGRRGAFTYGEDESKDLDAAVRFLFQSKGIRRVGVIGHSVGAASAILSAARNPEVGAVVAVAPFNSVAEVWYTSRPAFVPSLLLNWTMWAAEKLRGFRCDQIRPIEVVARIAPRPLLIVHGTGDLRITETQVRRLFAAAREPKSLWLVQGATHDGIRNPVLDQLAPDVIAFFDAALPDGQAKGALAGATREGTPVIQ
jgi:dipeptidyl aminopeptidase/acylaminoacyl peptidase